MMALKSRRGTDAASCRGREAMATQNVNLTDREKQLLRGIMDDKTYSEIAFDLKLSHETIKSYAARIRAKLGINTKTGLALWAAKNLR